MNSPGPERGRDVQIDVAPDGEVEDVSQPRVRDEHHGVVVDVPIVLHREPRGLRVRLREHAELVPGVLLQVLYLGGEPGDLTLGEVPRDVQNLLRGTGGEHRGVVDALQSGVRRGRDEQFGGHEGGRRERTASIADGESADDVIVGR